MSQESAAKEAKDWHSSKHIGKRASHLREHPDEEIPSDVTFLVGDGENQPQKVFNCHKFILAMVSSKFQARFYGLMPQTEDIIKVPDVTPTAFQHMLLYAYGEIIEIDDQSLENALDTLYCAKKYHLDKLARTCRDHIQLQIAAFEKYPCSVFERAPQMDEDDLATLALAGIALNACAVMKNAALVRLPFEFLKRIVDYPRLNAEEVVIYRGVRRWVKHNVKIIEGGSPREAFGSLLYSIRFPLISGGELTHGPVEDGVLTDDEIRLLRVNSQADLPFVTTPRIPVDKPLVCYIKLVTVPSTAEFGNFIRIMLFSRPDLAPECCAYWWHMMDNKLHIRIASFDNENVGKTAPLPAAVQAERNVLSHSIQGACWFEWDVEDGVACNVRIGVGKKPHLYHSAVFGFAVGIERDTYKRMPFTLWDDQRIRSVTGFECFRFF